MSKIVRGLYQTLITHALQSELSALGPALAANDQPLHRSEVADRIALHLAGLIARAVNHLDEGERVSRAVELAQEIVARLEAATEADLVADAPALPGSFLTAVLNVQPDGRPETLAEPLIPLLDTALMTNAPGEPRVGHQIVAEIPSADRIDFVMAFIRRSGIRPMLAALRRHCEAGRALRVLTTVYTGSTESDALAELTDLGADVRVSYDVSGTRLHAKAWLFHRHSGFSTAYIGSSNLTYSAQVSGLEWNVRVSAARNRPVIDKVAAVFESYWHSEDFVSFDAKQFADRTAQRSGAPATTLSPIELRPEPFQERLLEQIALARQRGHHRNLLVSATGTGKTVMAAVDYARLHADLPRARLLFVAHRKEILAQSLAIFRHALRDASFGELWVDGARPDVFDHVFASIQSLSSAALERLDPAHFDVVIVDEFHHAAAPSYRSLLDRVQPTELLGLTATPERSDGLSLLHWFDGRIAAELRLWDAIDQQRLVPFIYYGIADELDFTAIPWRRGRGYDVEGLTNLFTANDAWARYVIHALTERVDDTGTMRALGFCVSVTHAQFMARLFNDAGITAVAIWADTPALQREQALRDLRDRRVNIIFSVDIFNEGVDVPAVDTLLMLRPTDSPTLFLQQLGRGLRRHHGKHACTVLDFIGLHHREFRFDKRLGALLGGTRGEIARNVEQGFPYLPAGCHMELDRIASERVLRGIRNAVPDRWTAKVEALREIGHGDEPVLLSGYLEHAGLTLEDLYSGGRSWSDLKEAAGLTIERAGPKERELRKACGRMLHIDDAARIEAYREILRGTANGAGSPTIGEDRFRRMLVSSVVGNAVPASAALDEAHALLLQHPQIVSELLELMDVLLGRLQHVEIPLPSHPNVPLRIHARYTRIEIQAAFGDGNAARVPTWREGVKYVQGEKSDVLLFTLDKTSGRFSPTTRYRDYAISRELIHWESQSTTRADSPTGRRYQAHVAEGTSIMLFARLADEDRAFFFLGPADYVRHESETPMAVTWRLKHVLPGDLFQAFAAAVA